MHAICSIGDNADWGVVYLMSTGAAITGMGPGGACDGFAVGLLVPSPADVRNGVTYNDGDVGSCVVPAAAVAAFRAAQ